MKPVEVFAHTITIVAAAFLVDAVLTYKRSMYKEQVVTTNGRTFNNPGNIEKRKLINGKWSRNLFRGEVSDGGDARFTSFVDMKRGYRAIARILKTKYNRGLKTLQAMISDYSPEADGNDVAAYVEHVAVMADVDPNKDMNEYPGAKWADVIEAIAVHEQGQSWLALYGDKMDEWALQGYNMA